MGTKKNDSSAAEKLLSLYTRLLFSSKAARLGVLAEELDCSKQAVRRLIEHIEKAGYGTIIQGRQGRETTFRLEKPAELPPLNLDAEALQQLMLYRDFVTRLMPESTRQTVMAEPAGEEDEEEARVFSSSRGRIDYAPYRNQLHTLLRGIKEHRVCEVRYKASLQSGVQVLDFAPMRLVTLHEALHVHGWLVSEAESGKAQKLYDNSTNLALHRIESVTLTRRTSAHLPKVSREAAGRFGLTEDETFRVKIKFSPAAATYAAERQWSDDQKIKEHDDHSITLTMSARSSLEVTSWVLGFADGAEVLSPKWLRDEIRDRVEVLRKKYGAE